MFWVEGLKGAFWGVIYAMRAWRVDMGEARRLVENCSRRFGRQGVVVKGFVVGV